MGTPKTTMFIGDPNDNELGDSCEVETGISTSVVDANTASNYAADASGAGVEVVDYSGHNDRKVVLYADTDD